MEMIEIEYMLRDLLVFSNNEIIMNVYVAVSLLPPPMFIW